MTGAWMRYLFLVFCLITNVFASSNTQSNAGPDLVEAVKEYQNLQTRNCSTEIGVQNKSPLCSVESFCKLSNIQKDSPWIYQSINGRKIVNNSYYADRAYINSCLRETFSDDIQAKRDDLTTQLKATQLKKIIAANKALTALIDKYGQGAKVQKISSEILTLSMQDGLAQTDESWERDFATRTDLAAVITKAEKITKIVLNPEVKKALLDLQYLKKNPNYQAELDKFEARVVPEVKMTNPLFNFELLTDAKAAGGQKALLANQDLLKQRTIDGFKIFQETQNEIIEYLESKRNETNVTKIERAIDRVKTIKFKAPRLTESLVKICTSPNAFYDSNDHSMSLCPQFLDFPATTIKETFAHELSHSFDSCNLSGEKYQVKGPQIVEAAPFEIDFPMPPLPNNFVKTAWDDVVDNPRANPKNKLQDKMLYADHPFSKTLSCLQGTDSVGAISNDPKTVSAKVKAELQDLSQAGENTPSNARARYLNYFDQHQEDYFNYFQGCDLKEGGQTLGRSQLQEAFADKMASEIMARNFQILSKVDAQRAVLEIILGYDDVCTNENSSEEKLRNYAAKYGCKNYFENKTHESKMLEALRISDPLFDPHPMTSKRIERSLFAHPEILKALQCPQVAGVKYCE